MWLKPICKDRKGNGLIRVQSVDILDSNYSPVNHVKSGSEILFHLNYTASTIDSLYRPFAGITFYSPTGETIMSCRSDCTDDFPIHLPPSGVLELKLPKLPLAPGNYPFTIYIEINNQVADWVRYAGTLRVLEGNFYQVDFMPKKGVGPCNLNHLGTVKR